MKQLKEIAQIWIDTLNPTEEQANIVMTRSIACDGCDKKQYNTQSKFHFCGECNCQLSGKIYTPANFNGCPLNKWKL